MSKMLSSLCVSFVTLCSTGFADEVILPQEASLPDLFEAPAAAATTTQTPTDPLLVPPSSSEPPAPAVSAPVQTPTAATPKPQKLEVPFSPFTGKIKGKKVRLRLGPDLDSQVVRELNKGDVIAVVGEKGDFYAVEPPKGIKAYVFRSFVLDNVIEGNRVNIRIEPSLDAAVIGHLNSGDKISGTVSAQNSKWYEISPPASTRFYIAKELVTSIGGPELKAQIDHRRNAAEQLLHSTTLLTTVEMNKPFEEIHIDQLSQNYKSLINDFTEFSDLVSKAQESLTALQENYLQKRIAFLETKSAPTPALVEEEVSLAASNEVDAIEATDKMKLWEPIEEALYLSWAQINDNKGINDYYEEQKLAAVPVTGIIEAYASPVKNKPGDFIVRSNDLPVAYIYSTKINLQQFVGKKVSLLGMPRPNNNFAFPAYAVLAVE